MPHYPLYHVDAFVTDRPFSGSGAAVVPLEAWIEPDLMQAIAAQNNLSETAFFVREGEGWRIRWFTPTMEVDLCGHATLASAFVLFEKLDQAGPDVRFQSASGVLMVRRDTTSLVLDFPARPAFPAAPPADLLDRIVTAMHAQPSAILKSTRDWLLVFDTSSVVAGLRPDHADLARFADQGFIVTAPGDHGADYVFRYFAPALGLNEDPATGSVQSTLVPYWADRLKKSSLRARQLSRRGAEFELSAAKEAGRIYIGGRCRPYLEGILHV